MAESSSPKTELSRRSVLVGAVAVGVASSAAASLAGCGDGNDAGPSTQDAASSSPATVSAAAVPVGGGTIVADQRVVVTQPAAGEFKAFSAVCTHQGCVVAKVENGTISCACHNSMFSAADGSVLAGPATRKLDAKKVTVSGDTITVS